MTKYILFYILLFFISIKSHGQTKPYVYYFDKDLRITVKDSAIFTGMGWDEDSHIKLRCFNNINKTMVFLAYFTDTTLNVFDGLFQSYYPNGDIENEGKYVKGMEDGLWQRWNYLKNITDSILYKNGKKLMAAKVTYHPNQNFESKVIDDIKNAKIYTTYYDIAGIIIYKDSVNERTREDSVFIKPEIEASFPGGQPAWMEYIIQLAKKNKRAIRKDQTAGTCHVRFEVDKEGNISNLKVLTMNGTAMSRILSDAITTGPKWIPATEQGRPVKSVKEVPITYDSATF